MGLRWGGRFTTAARTVRAQSGPLEDRNWRAAVRHDYHAERGTRGQSQPRISYTSTDRHNTLSSDTPKHTVPRLRAPSIFVLSAPASLLIRLDLPFIGVWMQLQLRASAAGGQAG